LLNLKSAETIQSCVAVIAGALILLTLTTSGIIGGIDRYQITFITADIIFPFAISALLALFDAKKHDVIPRLSTRFMVAGFINLMISISLLAIIGF
jgi:hypothetical protein